MHTANVSRGGLTGNDRCLGQSSHLKLCHAIRGRIQRASGVTRRPSCSTPTCYSSPSALTCRLTAEGQGQMCDVSRYPHSNGFESLPLSFSPNLCFKLSARLLTCASDAGTDLSASPVCSAACLTLLSCTDVSALITTAGNVISCVIPLRGLLDYATALD